MSEGRMAFPRSRRLAGGIVIAMALVLPQVASAQPAAPAGGAPKSPAEVEKNMAEAKSRYKAGLTLYDDGAFDAARVQFERAYDLSPSYKILYNIGLVYKQLNEFVGSLKALQKYLAEGGPEVPDDRKVEVSKMIETLKPIVGYATITVSLPTGEVLPGAEITVDDATVAKSPMLDPIMVNPGRRKIGAKLEGRLPDTKIVTVASGDKVNVTLSLAEPTKTIVKGSDYKPVVAWIVTGALAVGAGVTSYLTLSASNSLDDAKKTRNPDPPAPQTLSGTLNDDRDKMRTLGLVADILIVGTVLSAGVASYFTWFRKEDSTSPVNVKVDKPGNDKAPPPPAPAAKAFDPKPNVSFSLGGAYLTGTF